MKNPMFAQIPSLAEFNGAEYILKRAAAYEEEDAYLEEAGMFMDDLIQPVSVAELFTWYAADPETYTEYADEYIISYLDLYEDGKHLPPQPSIDIMFGGLWVALEHYLVACYDELKGEGKLPWQNRCSYCEQMPEEQVRKDRIGELTCKRCWDPGVDGPW